MQVVRNPETGRFFLECMEGPRRQRCIQDLHFTMLEFLAKQVPRPVTPSPKPEAAAINLQRFVAAYREVLPVDEHARVDAWTLGSLRADVEKLERALSPKLLPRMAMSPFVEIHRPQRTVTVEMIRQQRS